MDLEVRASPCRSLYDFGYFLVAPETAGNMRKRQSGRVMERDTDTYSCLSCPYSNYGFLQVARSSRFLMCLSLAHFLDLQPSSPPSRTTAPHLYTHPCNQPVLPSLRHVPVIQLHRTMQHQSLVGYMASSPRSAWMSCIVAWRPPNSPNHIRSDSVA